MNCRDCPRECGGDRSRKNGVCRSGTEPKIARAALHFGEEPCISGQRGSGTVFFSGCCLGCVFCQNEPVSHGNFGHEVSVGRLADIFAELEQQGAENINLVNPTHFTRQIIRALDRYRPKIPIIYNCGGYEKTDLLRALKGYADVYLPDFKYAGPGLAEKFSGASDYPRTALAAIREMLSQTGNIVLNERGSAVRGTMIRHLVLPLHTHDSMRTLDLIAAEFGPGVWISLMFQYTPMREHPQFPELNRPLTAREREKVENHLHTLGFSNGYIQQAESSGKEHIPSFDLAGVLPADPKDSL